MNLKKLVVIVTVAALLGSAMAQGGGGGRGQRGGGGNQNSPTGLLTRADVKKDLSLTDDQNTKLTEIRTGLRQKMQDARTAAGDDRAAQQAAMAKIGEESAKEINAVLTADQQKRLKEIFIQLRGAQAVLNPEVQKDLEITGDQKTKIADLQKRQQQANADIRAKVQSGEIEQTAVRELQQKNTKVLNEEINGVLTDAQKSKLKEMGGKTFTADPPAAGGGRRGGGN